ncbi:uncharacterized protein K460DRAFT_121223 [Cucurbitaria berberidis CBS 394.84]|uniref:Secreted protein n=1 Tax=Cucurbitaria berberidis CBS 394.84 TaxID=1168544 RepID=A0A9P4GIQ3_9PLEO|nr:uncharacterized protein K460DRAFT_121223 [Cucurbitaria berberidis CBS 394.84]KAF1846194.1 hypothetical protein K460DRAFT_121223 [Cucurbitaria berberidis CBS 394.84]
MILVLLSYCLWRPQVGSCDITFSSQFFSLSSLSTSYITPLVPYHHDLRSRFPLSLFHQMTSFNATPPFNSKLCLPVLQAPMACCISCPPCPSYHSSSSPPVFFFLQPHVFS